MATALPPEPLPATQARGINHAPLDGQTPASIGQPQPEPAAEPRDEQTIHAPGYFPGLSELTAFRASSSERTIYRRFRYLSSANLAHLESELAVIQQDLEVLDQADQDILEDINHSDHDHVFACHSWFRFFQERAELADGPARERMRLMTRLRATMKEYQSALIGEHRMLAMRSPSKRTHELFQKVLGRKESLATVDGVAALKTARLDLVTTFTGHDENVLIDFLEAQIGKWQLKAFKSAVPPQWGDMYDCSNRQTRLLANSLVMIMVIGLLACALAVIDLVRETSTSIGIAGGFTLIFAAVLEYFANARREEILVGTAAYAGMLIVFVAIRAVATG